MSSGGTTTDTRDVVLELNTFQRSDNSKDAVDAPRLPPDISTYYHVKKSIAEGMMDISLLTANANQLKFILYYNQRSRTFYPALSLIVLSLVLQISIGFLLIFRVSFAIECVVHASTIRESRKIYSF